jgi:hypothetical protein
VRKRFDGNAFADRSSYSPLDRVASRLAFMEFADYRSGDDLDRLAEHDGLLSSRVAAAPAGVIARPTV